MVKDYLDKFYDKLWEIELNMNPVAQGRPKFSARGGFVRAYDPKKSADMKLLVKALVSESAPAELLTGALIVVIGSYILPPKLKKAHEELAKEDKLAPLHKPDTDNYYKGVCDACNKVIWADDSLIVDSYSYKRYSYKPRVAITVYRAKVEGR